MGLIHSYQLLANSKANARWDLRAGLRSHDQLSGIDSPLKITSVR